jgi:hypothetical protein
LHGIEHSSRLSIAKTKLDVMFFGGAPPSIGPVDE